MFFLQIRFFIYFDGDVVVSIIFSDQGYYRLIFGWVSGVDCEEFFSVVFGESVYLDGVAYSIGEKEYFNLGEE